MKVLLTILLLSYPLQAQQAQLAALRTTIMSLREDPNTHREMRGAIPLLTTAKNQLRAWIEVHLTSFPENGDEAELAQTIHDGIGDAQLFCTDFNLDCYPTHRGFLDEVRIHREQEFLIVRTAVGIWCGCASGSRRSGCNIGMPRRTAAILTGGGVSVCFLPAGSSGRVTTPARAHPFFTNASSMDTAKSDVPKKRMRMFECCSIVISGALPGRPL